MINLAFLLRAQISRTDFSSRLGNDYTNGFYAGGCFSRFRWAYLSEPETFTEVASCGRPDQTVDQFCSFEPPRTVRVITEKNLLEFQFVPKKLFQFALGQKGGEGELDIFGEC